MDDDAILTLQQYYNEILIFFINNFWLAILIYHFLFLTIKFTDLSLKMSRTAKKSTKRIPVTAKNATKVWNSLAVFFSYIIYYKILFSV